MSGLTDGAVIREFREFDIEVKLGSLVLDRRELQAFKLAGHYLEEKNYMLFLSHILSPFLLQSKKLVINTTLMLIICAMSGWPTPPSMTTVNWWKRISRNGRPHFA
jgi:hypothetical protein